MLLRALDDQPTGLACVSLDNKASTYRTALRSHHEILIFDIPVDTYNQMNPCSPTSIIQSFMNRPNKQFRIETFHMDKNGIYFVANNIIEYVPHDNSARSMSKDLWEKPLPSTLKNLSNITPVCMQYSNILVFDRGNNGKILVVSCIVKRENQHQIYFATVKHANNSFVIISQNRLEPLTIKQPTHSSNLMTSLAKVNWDHGRNVIVLYEEIKNTLYFFELAAKGHLEWFCMPAFLEETIPNLEKFMVDIDSCAYHRRTSVWTSEKDKHFYLILKNEKKLVEMKIGSAI